MDSVYTFFIVANNIKVICYALIFAIISIFFVGEGVVLEVI